METGSWYCPGMVRALFCVCDGRGIDGGEEGPGELERNRNQTHGKSYCGGHHSGVSWYQPKEYVSYRIWVDNTTNNSMRVTITDPQGRIRTFSVPAHGNKSYVGNGVESGTYRLSFSTSNGVLSGTVRVRVSDVALS